MNLTCRFIDGLEITISVLPMERMPAAPTLAEEIERRAAASDVAPTPAVTKEWNAIDTSGTKSVSAKRIRSKEPGSYTKWCIH